MRVGVISKGSPDYLIDVVTDGLIRLLGRHNVSLDYNVRGSVGGSYVHLCQGFEGPEPFNIFEADVLVASNRSIETMRKWRREAGAVKPIAFIDGEDHDVIDSGVLEEVSVYFKREYLKGRTYPAMVRPLPFGAIPELIPPVSSKDIPFSFMADVTHEYRHEIFRGLRVPSLPVKLPKADYNRNLAQSMIGVSVRGMGWDTYRYWEVPYFGALLLSQRLQTVIPGDFKDGQEAVFFDDVTSLPGVVEGLLADPPRLAEIAQAGHLACVTRHLSVHRATTALEALL